MATALTTWAPEIDPFAPGLPLPALQNAVRNAARRFCNQTLLWKYTLTAITVVANTQTVTLTVPPTEYGEIVGIDDVRFKITGAANTKYRTLEPVAESSEDLYGDGPWKWQTATQPSHFGVDVGSITTLYLYPIPTVGSTSGLLVSVNLMPIIAATVVPDFLYNTHLQAITDGALEYLLRMRNMPWFDPGEAQLRGLAFRGKINSAKWAKFTGATKRPLKVKLRAFV